MTRVVSLFLPTLSTDRVRRKSGDAAPPVETPLVLVGRDGRRRVVLAADAAAQAAGLRVGMPASKAQVLVPGLIIQDAAPAADAEALDRLALWMLRRFAPIVAPDPVDGIVIDSTGADHLHGGEAAMLAILIDKLAGVGIQARGAIADTWGAAHALARFAARLAFISEPGAATTDLAPLPIEALRLAPELNDTLRVLGFERISDLLAQPRAPLTLRFGPELGRRLDQATRPDRRTHRTDPAVRTDRGPPRLRRTDWRGRNHRPLYRQACRPSSAKRLSSRGSARAGSISFAIASTTALKPCASARRCRCATPSV